VKKTKTNEDLKKVVSKRWRRKQRTTRGKETREEWSGKTKKQRTKKSEIEH
jgi:hypothetical protein